MSGIGIKRRTARLTNVQKVLEQNVEQLIQNVQHNLASDGSNASMKLSQSIAPEIDLLGHKVSIKITMEEYWKAVDQGRRAGTWPEWSTEPVSVGPFVVEKTFPGIAKWIAQKPITIRAIPPKGGMSDNWRKNQYRSLAFLIARKIYRHGTRGTGFFEKEKDPFVRRLKKQMAEALKKDVRVYIRTKWR